MEKEQELYAIEDLLAINKSRKEYNDNCLQVIKDSIKEGKDFHIGIIGKDDTYEEIIPCDRYLAEYIKCYFINKSVEYEQKILSNLIEKIRLLGEEE